MDVLTSWKRLIWLKEILIAPVKEVVGSVLPLEWSSSCPLHLPTITRNNNGVHCRGHHYWPPRKCVESEFVTLWNFSHFQWNQLEVTQNKYLHTTDFLLVGCIMFYIQVIPNRRFKYYVHVSECGDVWLQNSSKWKRWMFLIVFESD